MTQILHGIVEHGDKRGRELGFPTANLPIHGHPELDGVWAGRVEIEGRSRVSATVSIGRRPTYYSGAATRLIEVHVLDFAGNLYGRSLTVELVHYLRDQVSCANDAELIELMTQDVHATRNVLAPQGTLITLPWLGLVPA